MLIFFPNLNIYIPILVCWFQIRAIEELEKIKTWNLLELILDGNDLCDRFKDQAAYIR